MLTKTYCKGYPKHKKENTFLNYMNVAMGDSKCIKKNKRRLNWQFLFY